MSRIDELLADLCPEGVEFVRLGDSCNVFNGCAFKAALFNNEGRGLPLIRIRDLNTGFSQTYYSGEYDVRYIVEDGDILIGMDGDFRAVRWKHGRALLNQRVCRLQDFKLGILPAFMYYVVQDELDRIHGSIQGSTVKHLSSKELERSRVPMPPLEVQREIVELLDRFTALETELEVELTTELEARHQQYASYRDALLAFSDQDIRWVAMAEVGEFFRGRRFTKADYVEDGVPCIHYGDIYTQYGTVTETTTSHVDAELAPTLRFAQPGDLIIAGVGETVEDVGKAVAWLGHDEVAIHDDCFAFRHSLNPQFVSYYFQSTAFHAEKNKFVARAKVKRLSAESLAKLTIPVPSPEEQARIVAILDKFEELVNNISVGLPAEIAARRRQYAYYRDRLLTFKEAA
jgi:type I restriction enzyme S subunit